MKIRPILFNSEMVEAILNGQKRVTRRKIDIDVSNQFDIEIDGTAIAYIDQKTGDTFRPEEICRIKKEDVLYVRETWAEWIGGYAYKIPDPEAVWNYPVGSVDKWKPSIHMPKCAARIWLKVSGIRAERLNDISEDQAIKEGTKESFPPLALDEFPYIWDSTIPNMQLQKYGWAANPWVWVIEFERCEKPEEYSMW